MTDWSVTVVRTAMARAATRKAAEESGGRKMAGAAARRSAGAEARREAILAAALDEFTARGYEGARLDDVARRAGVAKGTIYLYFTDKQALFQDLVRSMVSPILGTLEKLPQVDMPGRVLVERLTDTFVREIIGTRRKDI